MKKQISTEKAPAAIGPYSQAILCGDTLFVSGQIPFTPDGKKPEGIEGEARQSLENVKSILEEAGFSLEDVVMVQAYLINPDDFEKFNSVYSEYFSSKPARTTVFVKALPKNSLVEISVIAKKC